MSSNNIIQFPQAAPPDSIKDEVIIPADYFGSADVVYETIPVTELLRLLQKSNTEDSGNNY